ncbi:MAG: hypothetical protein AAF668_15940 [Pseudomonadota bacterium]
MFREIMEHELYFVSGGNDLWLHGNPSFGNAGGGWDGGFDLGDLSGWDLSDTLMPTETSLYGPPDEGPGTSSSYFSILQSPQAAAAWQQVELGIRIAEMTLNEDIPQLENKYEGVEFDTPYGQGFIGVDKDGNYGFGWKIGG